MGGVPAATVTVPDVELVRVGKWAASTGVVRIEPEDLAAMLTAYADPEVDRAAVRIGHIDPRFDGEPALGWITNPRVDGDRLVADLAGVPAGLADVLPSAFRRRSVELAWGLRTPSGKRYRVALTGLALLGVAPPAVKGLADVERLFDAPERTAAAGDVEAESTTAVDVVPADPTNEAAVEYGAFLARLSAEAAVEVLDALRTPPVSIPPTRPEPGHRGAREDDRGGPAVPVTRQAVEEFLGQEFDADADQLMRELAQLVREQAGEGQTGSDPGPGEGQPQNPTPPQEPAPEPDPQEGELVKLSSGTWAEVQAQLAEGREARAILRRQEREAILEGALREGRIAPAERSHFAAALERDHEGTVSLLSGLTPRFPVGEVGSAAAPDAAIDDAAWDAFEASTFPELNRS